MCQVVVRVSSLINNEVIMRLNFFDKFDLVMAHHCCLQLSMFGSESDGSAQVERQSERSRDLSPSLHESGW